MTSLQPLLVAGSSIGLKNDTKPYISPDQSFTELDNAYVWRERVRKREGFEFIGRLRRYFERKDAGISGASPWTFNIYSIIVPPIVPEPNAEIDVGSVVVTIQPVVITGAITSYNNATNCEVQSAAHGLSTGDIISISGVVVVEGSGPDVINGGPYTISVVGVNSFTINRNSETWGVYESGGTWTHVTSAINEQLFDQGDGTLATDPVSGVTGVINYLTGDVTITGNTAGNPVIITFGYFPSLPVMGIWQREQAGINQEQTIFFDTKYAYEFASPSFVEFLPTIPPTTWNGSDSDFFWAANYRGILPSDRLFFVTNFVNNAQNPMRYTDGALIWNTFAPVVSQSGALNTRRIITSARIIIPYYGRLLLLNTWESGADAGGNPAYSGSQNFFNRCSFSQIGNPLEVYDKTANPKTGAFAIDIFGKGGFIDAPTNEEIISAAFIKNSLIVFFEKSTWQLRYVGEYGLPFIWERISSDYGSESTFSTVLFDQGVLAIGDRAIISANAVTVDRIDAQIPDQVFNILNDLNGVKRVCGIRDFQRELVFWCYPDFPTLNSGQYFPNKVLVYNYKNNSYALFDDNVTFFGTLQPPENVTWSNLDIFWDDEDVLWDDVNLQNQFPRIVAGNQQGFVGYYGYVFPDETSETISAINLAVVPNEITVFNHNLQSQEINNVQTGDIIRITGAIFDGAGDPGINDNFYQIQYVNVNTVSLFEWTGATYAALALTPAGTYLGGGKITVFPRMNIVTKDFNPYLQQGLGLKLSRIDFLFDTTSESAVSIIIFPNTSYSVVGNLIVGNEEVETTVPANFPGTDYAWHQFFATLSAQFVRIAITYDDTSMNDIETHRSTMVLNAYCLWTRPGGRISAI